MITLTEFLLARIGEDEAVARAVIAKAAPDEWENPTSWGNFYSEEVAFWDRATPARILAECAAKKAIILGAKPFVCADMHDESLRALATVYADHHDYQPAWAQEG